MPTSQYDRHTLHCALGSTSSSSHSSVFPAALIASCDYLLKGLFVDVVEDHFEVLVAEGGSRSSESNFERRRHVIVSLQNVVLLEC